MRLISVLGGVNVVLKIKCVGIIDEDNLILSSKYSTEHTLRTKYYRIN